MNTITENAKPIKLLIIDVDGVLTAGIIYYGDQGTELKGFHVHDGLGIALLQKTGVMVAVISAKKSAAVAQRMQDLQIQHAYLGYDDKVPVYEDLKQKLQLSDREIAYMGDDLIDLPVLLRAGLAITVPQAPKLLHQHADIITKRKAGKGAVREACEIIMEAQETYESMVQPYLTR